MTTPLDQLQVGDVFRDQEGRVGVVVKPDSPVVNNNVVTDPDQVLVFCLSTNCLIAPWGDKEVFLLPHAELLTGGSIEAA